MAGTKLQQFTGMTPRVSEELLPENTSHEAVNCAMHHGDIVPAGQFVQPPRTVVGLDGGVGDAVRTIYGFRNPANADDIVVLSWDDDVRCVLGPTYASGADQLLYYTDKTGARMTTYRRVKRMGAPYPKNSYKLGMPLPDEKLKVEATSKKIPGYDGSPLPGVKELPNLRSYVFTYFCDLFETSWESIASEPSDPIEVVEGTVCKVSGLPWQPPVDGTQDEGFPIGGINLYRTVTSTSGTEFFKVVTLPFYCPIASITIDGDKQTIVTHNMHNLQFRAFFKTGDAMAVTQVTEVVDEYTIVATYRGGDAYAGGAVPCIHYDITPQWTRAAATQRRHSLWHKKKTTHDSPVPSPDPETGTGFRWWDGTDPMRFASFEDDYDVVTLTRALKSDDYDPPPRNLSGIVRVNDKVLCGHANGKLYFSEPGVDIAWPALYETLVPEPVVAIEPISGGVLVLTTGHPYIAHVSDPAAGIQIERLSSRVPCLSAATVVATPYGVVWMTTEGLAVFGSGGAGLVSAPTIVTQHDWNYDFSAGSEWRIPCTDSVSLSAPTKPTPDELHLIAKHAFAWWDGWNYNIAWPPSRVGSSEWMRVGMLSFVREGDSQHFVRWFLSDGSVAPGSGGSGVSQPVSPPISVYTGWAVAEDLDLYGFLTRTWRDVDGGHHPWFDFAWSGFVPTFDDSGKRIVCKANGRYPGRNDGMQDPVVMAEVYGAPKLGSHEYITVKAGETYRLTGSVQDKHTEPNIADGDNSAAPLRCTLGVKLVGAHNVTYERWFWCQADGECLFTVPDYVNNVGSDEWLLYPVVEFSRSFLHDIETARASGTPQVPTETYGVTMNINIVPRLYKMTPVSLSSDPVTERCLLLESGSDDPFVLENGAGFILLEGQTASVPVAPPVAGQYSAVPQAVWHDALLGHTYCVYRNSSGGIVGAAIDLRTQVATNAARWKSKAFITPMYCNFGAARVVADFPENNTTALVTFRLYVNKVLVAEVPLSSSMPFRLPTNYRADTFEVELVNIRCRVRAVHLAETVIGLREV